MRRIEKTTLASAMLIACCGACAPTPVRTVRGDEFSGWPKPVVRVLPEATDSALRRRESGFVVTRHVVDQTGRVVSVEVVDSSPDGVYERAVRAAIRQWRYESLEIDERVQSEPIGGVIVFCVPEDPCEFELPGGVEVIEFDPSALGPRR